MLPIGSPLTHLGKYHQKPSEISFKSQTKRGIFLGGKQTTYSYQLLVQATSIENRWEWHRTSPDNAVLGRAPWRCRHQGCGGRRGRQRHTPNGLRGGSAERGCGEPLRPSKTLVHQRQQWGNNDDDDDDDDAGDDNDDAGDDNDDGGENDDDATADDEDASGNDDGDDAGDDDDDDAGDNDDDDDAGDDDDGGDDGDDDDQNKNDAGSDDDDDDGGAGDGDVGGGD